jgi:GT2 family glycosyltransferase
MSAAPLVSVVIVNWNGAQHLRICLPSLLAQSYPALEIIVADNSSKDDSAKVAEEYQVRWLPLEGNRGLAPAMNCGANVATGEFLLFVNNDMRFDREFVAELVAPLVRDAERQIFATDAMQFNWDETERGHLAARLSKKAQAGKSSAELVPGLHFYQQEKTDETAVFMASAACMMARRTVFEQLGGLDDRLPLGYEDVEICWRAWTLGWKTLYVPSAVCWHRVGSSIQSVAAARFGFRGVLKGRLLLATKLLPARYAVRTWAISMAALGKDLLRFKWSFATDRIKVLWEMAGLVPELLREKTLLFKNAGCSAEKQLEFLLRLTDYDARNE